MADDNNNTDRPVLLPTFSSLRASNQVGTRSSSAGRLHWTLSDPLASSIFIMPNSRTPDPASLVPYTTEDPFAHELMTHPAVRSIKVHVYTLANWEDGWKDAHIEHCEPSPDRGQTVIVSEDGGWEMRDDHNNPVKLVTCCGEQRPGPEEPLEVRASDEARGVTIDDYLQAVHPWLMARRADIVSAMQLIEDVSVESVLMVNVNGPAVLMTETKERWIHQCQFNRI